MQRGEFIDCYEDAVLEWFHAAYPALRVAIQWHDSTPEGLLGKDRSIRYPSLVYHRVSSEWPMPVMMTSTDRDDSGTLHQASMFHVEQVYEASIYVEKQRELLKLANTLRQYWARNSYVSVRFPTDDDLLKVGLRLYNMQLVSNRDNLDTKGPERVLKITWRSDLLLYDEEEPVDYIGYRIWLSTDGCCLRRIKIAEGTFDKSTGEITPGVDPAPGE